MYKNILLVTLFSVLGILFKTVELIDIIFISILVIALLNQYFGVPWTNLFVTICIGMSIGWFSLGVFYQTTYLIGYNTTHAYEGVVSDYKGSDTAILMIKKVDDKITIPRKVRLKIKNKAIKIGQTIKFEGRIKRIDLPTNPGEANYRYIFYGKNVIGEVDKVLAIEYDHKTINGLSSRIMSAKERLVRRLSQHLSPDKVGLSLAMSVGDKGYLDKNDETGLRKLGLSHILVVSSLHVGLLVVLLSKQLNRLRVSYIVKEVILVVFLLLLLLIITSKISVLKCVFIYLAHLVAQYYNRKPFYLLSLALYTLMSVIINPFYLFNLSFSLSLMAYVGVFVYYRYSWKLCPRSIKLWYLTVCIYIGLLPIFLISFGGIHYLGLLISPFLMPYLEVVIGFNFLTIFIESIASIPVLVLILNQVLAPIKMLVLMANKLSEHFLLLPYGNGVVIGLALINVVLLICKKDSAKHKMIKRISVLLLLLVFISTVALHHLPMRIFYLDVGMGDSQYIYQGKTSMLIDGGTSYAENHIRDVMKITGEKIIDVGIISHEHNDHYGGIIGLLEDDLIKQLYLTEEAYRNLQEKYEVIERYNKMNQLTIVSTVLEIPVFDKWHVKIYPPPIKSENPNNHSLITLLQRKELEFLFTGDAESEEEKWIVAEVLKDIVPPLEYLKIPHHGSKTSSTESFLLAAKPNYGMISVGKNNRYGLPDEEILARYNAIGTKLFRTDHQGALEIKVVYPWIYHKDY